MKNSFTLLALVTLLIASLLTFASTMPAYSEGEESSQQTVAQTFTWTWIIVIFIIAVLTGALLIFMMAFLQRRRRRKQEENQRAVRIHLVR